MSVYISRFMIIPNEVEDHVDYSTMNDINYSNRRQEVRLSHPHEQGLQLLGSLKLTKKLEGITAITTRVNSVKVLKNSPTLNHLGIRINVSTQLGLT